MPKKNNNDTANILEAFAPYVFGKNYRIEGRNVYGTCPSCGDTKDHCSFTVLDGVIVGNCFKCHNTTEALVENIPEAQEAIKKVPVAVFSSSGLGAVEREHIYVNEFGKTLYKKVIYRKGNGDKTAKWFTLDTDGRTWILNLPNGQIAPIYHADKIRTVHETAPDTWVYLVEGEKDTDNLEHLGFVATSLPNGAVGNTRSIKEEWIHALSKLNLVIMGDNDEAGATSVRLLSKRLFKFANQIKVIMPTDLLDRESELIRNKYDVSDYIEEVGQQVAYYRIKSLTDTIPAIEPEEEIALPKWIFKTESMNGTETLHVDDALFCEYFIAEHDIHRINGQFYMKGEMVTDDQIKNMIQCLVQKYFREKTGSLTNNLVQAVENNSFTLQPEPDESKVFCAGDTTLIFDRAGNIETVTETIFTLTRLPVAYNPIAECPTFQKYLNDLFYEEDIPVIQEYLGYCMIPCTRAQAGLFIHGKGGEGKSVLRDVVMKLFGHAAVQEHIDRFESDRFSIANLESRLVSIDDDMKTEKLNETSAIKSLITAKDRQLIERKCKQKYEAYIYARIIALGNSFVGSKFDHSDGFYRRQLLIDCKPNRRDPKDNDRFMSDKVIAEIEGVLAWCVVGLQRLIRNNYNFSVSDRMRKTLDDIRIDSDSTLAFCKDDDWIIEDTEAWEEFIPSTDIWVAYYLFCQENAISPNKKRSFCLRFKELYPLYYSKLRSNGIPKNGYTHLRLTEYAKNKIDNLDSFTRRRIEEST